MNVNDALNNQENVQEFAEIRPKTLSSYIGQENIKRIISVSIQASKQRNEPLEHMLFYGPPGLGKTTIACVIANEMNKNIKITTGPAIERAGDMIALFSSLNEGDIVFIDEIHRLNKHIEEILYPAMEDFAVDIFIGEGPSKQSIRIELPKFTLIGATTRAGMLSAPLRDRFGTVNKMEFYTPSELTNIIKRSAQILKIEIDDEGAREIALLAIAVAVGLYFWLNPILGTEMVSWVCILGAVPFAVLGFVSYHGMPAEKFAWVWFRSEILEPKRYCFRPNNFYYELMKDTIAKHEKEAKNNHESH